MASAISFRRRDGQRSRVRYGGLSSRQVVFTNGGSASANANDLREPRPKSAAARTSGGGGGGGGGGMRGGRRPLNPWTLNGVSGARRQEQQDNKRDHRHSSEVSRSAPDFKAALKAAGQSSQSQSQSPSRGSRSGTRGRSTSELTRSFEQQPSSKRKAVMYSGRPSSAGLAGSLGPGRNPGPGTGSPYAGYVRPNSASATARTSRSGGGGGGSRGRGSEVRVCLFVLCWEAQGGCVCVCLLFNECGSRTWLDVSHSPLPVRFI